MDAKTLSKKRQCAVCWKVFASNSSLQVHMRVHTKEKPYVCHLCGNSFTQKSSLNTHLILHSGEKNFHCSYCGKQFALKIYKTTHEKSCKAKPEAAAGEPSNHTRGKYSGNIPQVFSSPMPMNQNKFQSPPISISNFTSENLKSLSSAADISNSNSYNVSSLPRGYTQQAGPVHINLMDLNTAHYQSRPHHVKYEPQASDQHTLLNLDDFAQRNKNKNEKPFQCKLCGQMYSQKSSFKTHLILHSGIKNFKCDWCDKRFALKLYKTSHEKSCRKKHTPGIAIPVQIPCSSYTSILTELQTMPSKASVAGKEQGDVAQVSTTVTSTPIGDGNSGTTTHPAGQTQAVSTAYIDEVEQLITS